MDLTGVEGIPEYEQKIDGLISGIMSIRLLILKLVTLFYIVRNDKIIIQKKYSLISVRVNSRESRKSQVQVPNPSMVWKLYSEKTDCQGGQSFNRSARFLLL